MVFRLCSINLICENVFCVCDIREKAAAPVCAKPFWFGEEYGTSAKKESEERTGRAHKRIWNNLAVMNPTNRRVEFTKLTEPAVFICIILAHDSLKYLSKSNYCANLLLYICTKCYLHSTDPHLGGQFWMFVKNTADSYSLIYHSASLHHCHPVTWIISLNEFCPHYKFQFM